MRIAEYRPQVVETTTHVIVCGVRIARAPRPPWGAEVKRRMAAKKNKKEVKK
ncbi:MAG: hypothetical protein WCO05_00925 [Candidatus Moraniibacteriota bacterium]